MHIYDGELVVVYHLIFVHQVCEGIEKKTKWDEHRGDLKAVKIETNGVKIRILLSESIRRKENSNDV
jgi:hypothetical protein